MMIKAGLFGALPVGVCSVASHGDQPHIRDLWATSQTSRDFIAVHFGQPNVHYDNVWFVFLYC
jgi:hypothetical protein